VLVQYHHLEHWRRHGYAVVERFLSEEKLGAVRTDLSAFVPTRQQYTSASWLYANDPGGGHSRELPFLGDTLNEIAVHADLVSFVERALGTRDLSLAQSIVWAKYGGTEDYDQPLHVDYMNHSLLYPRLGRVREEVLCLLYYSDVDESLGPTFIVSKEHTRDELLVPYRRSRQEFPDLHRLEQPLHLPAGSLLVYDTSTFHRGSRMSAPDGIRVSHHIVYRAASAPWIGYRHWGNYGLSAEMQRFVERASPRQRELVGIPGPGHPYWDESTLVGMAARYAGLDMEPYLDAAGLAPERRAAVGQRLAELRSQTPRDTGVVSAERPVETFWRSLATTSPGVATFWKAWSEYWAAASGVHRQAPPAGGPLGVRPLADDVRGAEMIR
jgi:Phytanoyl-CoA dioxygenase (PhyH)